MKMKKYFIIITSILAFITSNSCSDNDLVLYPPYNDDLETVNINTEEKLQQVLNSAYLSTSSSNAFGSEILMFGDLLSDHMFVSNSNSSYLLTYNLNYNSNQSDFGFYGILYDAITKSNLVINNTIVASNDNVERIKAEAKIIRGLAYFTLVNFYSPTPSSGINQEYGVPLVLGDYDVNIQPARSTVAEVYNQVISDLQAGVAGAVDTPSSKVILSKTAAKLLLTRVYLTRRAAGDAQLALQYATDIVENSPSSFAKINALASFDPDLPNGAKTYQVYFAGSSDAIVNSNNKPVAASEDQPETIWELDMNSRTNLFTGVGSNLSLPAYYNRTDSRRSFLFTKSFYDSFPNTSQTVSSDIRRGSGASGLLTTTGTPDTDAPKGVWTNKYPRFSQEGTYFRNIKILRFAEAQLNQIEALYLTGQTSLALTKLNEFALSRGGSTYTGADLLNDILTEKGKEFYGEGQRFFDLKRYSLPIIKNSNCIMNCNVPANDKLFVLPMSLSALNQNPNLKQYPGYN